MVVISSIIYIQNNLMNLLKNKLSNSILNQFIKYTNRFSTFRSLGSQCPQLFNKQLNYHSSSKKGHKSDLNQQHKQQKIIDFKYINFQIDQYGDYPKIPSLNISQRKWIKIAQVSQLYINKSVLIRARIHNVRAKGNTCFLVLRQQFQTIQAVAFKNQKISKEMIKFISAISLESIVDIVGTVIKPEKSIQKCTNSFEIHIQKIFVVNRATSRLPLQIQDASRKLNQNFQSSENNQLKQAVVNMTTRLNNRVIDLRTPAKQAIFKLSSGVCDLFRQFLNSNQFIQIHTPKIVPGSSEGGANVFKLPYFNKQACLAQSPQLYKQMCIMSDFDRVYEIGSVFRAQNSFTHRHMCQFMGLDIEMTIKQHYFELLDMIGKLFFYIFKGIQKKYERQLNIIKSQFEFQPFKFADPLLKLTFKQAIQILKQNQIEWKINEDLDTITQKKLGEIIKKKFDTDFYVIHRYPVQARPFYTMLCPDDPKFTCSYDFFIRGQQITSGAQRIHDPQILQKRALQCGIDPQTIRDYLNSFKYGAFPHGGCGIGLERVVMLYCSLKNIRNASLFPRDPHRLTP